ncbi:Gfo/Idh/MocA family protein [Kroppenstedtia eburnea]|uniref:Predicted dehydrogenase n=1 Tax=Kroppenstedtia eburnea TaxID=714067 RepID=A0A1N7K0L7_9BACL|nr:Gfo/Idh/MocA family oxidoreductase [Kroppenstedtia eburnea]QKI83372.1 Gfo/Idh/MocA family oxidoreductase [Kroppenstedtia eburnea]SIS54984.1 Predicted dehydrogenase [Kroppenstedtia eburnea]
MISVALLSKWHVHAPDYARQANDHPHLSIVKVWDEDPRRGQEWATELGVPFASDLNRVLEDPAIDGVIVNTATHLHKEVIMAAARNGKHIFTEKVLALTVADCQEIYATVESAQVKLMVSLPRLTDSTYLYTQQALEQGLLGRLTTIRCRLAHNGAVPSGREERGWLPQRFFDPVACGGGALIDLGAHPIYLTNRLAGPATAVQARLSSFLGGEVDDNAAVVVEYASGALGVIEAGFVSGGSPFLLECHGTEGSLMVTDHTVRLNSSRTPQQGWHQPENLPAPLPSPMEQWVRLIRHGIQPTITKEDVIRLTQINEAARLSHREERRVKMTSDQTN